MAGNVGIDRQIASDYVIENFDPTIDIGIENTGGLALAGMNLGIQKVAHEHHTLLGNVDRDIPGAVASAFRGNLKRETAEVNRHVVVKADVRPDQFFSSISCVARRVRFLALLEFLCLLHLLVLNLILARYVDWLVFAKMPRAGCVVSGGVRRDDVSDFFVGELSDRSKGLIG